MNQNNNNPQMPPSAQVPDQRLDQIMEQFRKMEIQNAQLRGQIDMMTRQQNPNAPKPKEPAFKPEVQAAIDEAIQAQIVQERARSQNQIGYLADQLDQANFQVKYGGEKYAKLLPKVEQLRQQYQAENKYVTREQALQMVHFEEFGKKGLTPDPAPQAQAAPPVYDPYLRAYVDPTTAQPVPQPQFQPEAEEPQAPPPAQAWVPAPQQQQPPPTWGNTPPGSRMQPGANHPNGNAYGQNFQLPGQGVNPPAPGVSGNQRPTGPLSLESSDAQLEAFESKYGDIPL